MRRAFGLFLGTLLLAAISGCSPYAGDYWYMPRPALAEIAPTPPQQTPAVTAMASVIGVRNADKKDGIPESVEIRFRLENNGPQTVTFIPQTLVLTDGNLADFPPAIVQPPQPATLPPAQSAVLTAYFPFPAGHDYSDIDLDSLQLRWLVRIDGQDVKQVVSFNRIEPAYYYPPYGPYPWYGGYGFGAVVVVHRR